MNKHIVLAIYSILIVHETSFRVYIYIFCSTSSIEFLFSAHLITSSELVLVVDIVWNLLLILFSGQAISWKTECIFSLHGSRAFVSQELLDHGILVNWCSTNGAKQSITVGLEVSDKVHVTVFVELMFRPARQLDHPFATFHLRVAECALASLLAQFSVDRLPEPALDTLNN